MTSNFKLNNTVLICNYAHKRIHDILMIFIFYHLYLHVFGIEVIQK